MGTPGFTLANVPMTADQTADRSRRTALRRWHWVHTWSSLICTAFLLVICVTGLLLVFADQIDQWLDPDPPFATLPAQTPRLSLDRLMASSQQMFPGQIVTSIGIHHDDPEVVVTMTPSWTIWKNKPRSTHWIGFDARTGKVVEQSKPPGQRHLGVLGIVYQLHMRLFAGLPGGLFMGLMALLFVTAIVSGVVLYGPFMKKLDFGTLRAGRGRRLKWLDLHNLLGIVVLAWTLVVGLTGVMNELSVPLFALWQRTEVQHVLARWRNAPAIAPTELSSPQRAYETALRAAPGDEVTSIVFPRPANLGAAGPSQYLLWTRGASHLKARLFDPVLVNARTGQLTQVARMPWYLRTLEISRPLHFGDYGGLPLKILWVCLDLITIVVLVSGLYLWIARRKTHVERLARIVAAHEGAQALPAVATRGWS